MNWQSQIVALLSASIVRPFALAAAAWLLLRIFRVCHPASRHAVWTAVLFGMLLLPILSVTAPHRHLPVLPRQRDVPAPALQPVAQAAPLPLPAVNLPEMPAAPRNGLAFILPLTTLIVWLYLAGCLAMIAYRAVGWVLLRRVVSHSAALHAPWLRESGDVVAPVAVGVLRPVVLLPAAWREWSLDTRTAVLAHEFAHIRRHDMLVSALARFVKSVLWFHPLAWWISRQVSDLAEQSCDAVALEAVRDPAGYARILLQFASAVNRAGQRIALPGLAMASPSGMGQRIDQVFHLSSGNLRKLARPRWVLALLGVPVLCLAAGAEFDQRRAPVQTPVALSPQPQAYARVVLQAQFQTPAQAQAQPFPPTVSSQPNLEFESASVNAAPQPAGTDSPSFGLRVSRDRVEIGPATLASLLQAVYGVKPYQLSGPDWMDGRRFLISAKMPAGATRAQVPGMLQSLLEERFGLAAHRAVRDFPVYELVQARSGARLQEAANTAFAAFLMDRQSAGAPPANRIVKQPDGALHFEVLTNLRGLADVLTVYLDRPVIDKTGIGGAYQIDLGPVQRPAGAVPDLDRPLDWGSRLPARGELEAPSGAGLRGALGPLGLNLESRNAPTGMLVVDRLAQLPQ